MDRAERVARLEAKKEILWALEIIVRKILYRDFQYDDVRDAANALASAASRLQPDSTETD